MNRNTLCKLFIFTVGAALGSAVTWKVVKTKYERIAQEEIDSVKEEYASLKQTLQESAVHRYEGPQDSDGAKAEEGVACRCPDDDECDFAVSEQEQIEYYQLTSRYRGPGDTADDKDDKEGGKGDEDEVPYINGPYVISPDDFASSPPGHNAQPLDYFVDGILADSWGVVMNIEETIGEDALNHFGDYVDDVVHVRNERTEVDYEVTRDPRTYRDAVSTNPNPYYGK